MCCSKSFIKRIVPFFLTFALGLFIASFFVTVVAPTLRFSVNHHQQWHQRLESENQQLKEENMRLKMQVANKEDFSDLSIDEYTAPLSPATVKDIRK